jgi:uncharacterized cupin superfamily protein
MNVIPIRQEGAKHTGPTELSQKIVIDGNPVFDTWTSAEVAVSGPMRLGTWIGEPGTIKMGHYPADEMFTLVFGKVEITNEDGSVLVLNPGDSGFMAKGWKGTWSESVNCLPASATRTANSASACRTRNAQP